MRVTSLVGRLLDVNDTVVEEVDIEAEDGAEVVVVSVRPSRRARGRCPQCRRSCPGYDAGHGVRRWRTVDMGVRKAYLQAAAPRVECREHGVLAAHVPWARPEAKIAYALEDTCAWMAARAPLTTVEKYLRLSWRAVADIVARVTADLAGKTDQLDGLTRIGVDEISYRKGQRYLMVVTDHDTGRMVWAREGRDQATLRAFFDDLGPDRCKALTHVSADGAEWIHAVIAAKAPKAVLCLDAFHVVMWANKALDKVRTRTLAAGAGRDKDLMWATRKNPEDLTPGQAESLACIVTENRALYRAYLLKEQLREIFRVKGEDGKKLLDSWISWARRCRMPEFVKLARTITRMRPLIVNTLTHAISNGRAENTNRHLRSLTTRAYGYHSPEALIGMGMLTRGGLCPALPGR